MLLSKKRIWTILLSASLIVQSIAAAAFGQASSTAGAIGGAITDQAGALVSGATVKVRNLDTGLERTIKTEDAGTFRFPTLPVGNYEITVDAQGFSQLKRSGFVVRVGDNLDLKLQLAASGTTEVVNVTAEAPVADPSKTEVATTIDEKSIHELPVNGRRWSQFVTLTPGVTMDGSFGLISFRGISGLLNNNTVDGGDNNQAFFSEERGRTRLNYVIGQESIKEFQVNTQNYSAEFGRSAGGVTNAVTKSGTNEVHGSGFYYIRDTALNARNPLNFITVGLTASGAPILQDINPPDRRQQFGGTLGGPLIKDKAFWFFSYDQQKRDFPVNGQPSSPLFFSDCVAPTASSGLKVGPLSACGAALGFLVPQTGIAPRRGDQLIFFPKFDWQINQKHQFTASYNYLNWDSPNGIQTQPVVAFAESGNGGDNVRVDSITLGLVSTVSPTKLNEARFQYARDLEFEPANAPSQVGLLVEGFQVGPPSFLPRAKFPNEKKYQFVDNFSIIHGSHTFKFGADLIRTIDDTDSLRFGFGLYTYNTRNSFSGVTNFGLDLATPGQKNYINYQQAFGPSTLLFHTWDVSTFAQDTWKVTRNITLNYGLRYEYIKMPEAQFPNPQFPQTLELPADTTDFGPRVGIAWDLGGSGKNVIRAGYGIYYGRIPNSSINNALINTAGPGSVLNFTITPTQAGAPVYPTRLSAPPTGAAAAKPSVFFFSPDLATPMIHQMDLVFERQITPNMSVSVSYLGSRGRRLANFFDQNLTSPNRLQQFLVLDSAGHVAQTVTLPIFTNARPNPNFGAIIEERGNVTSNYDAVVFQVNKRFSRGIQFLAHFTYSRAEDLNQTSTTFSSSFPTSLNQFDLEGERGRSNFDVPRRFVASAVWDIPFGQNSSNAFVKNVLGGWKLAPIVTLQDGFRLSGNISGSFPTNFTTPDGFVVPATLPSNGPNGSGGSFRAGFLPRNDFQMPALENIDLRLAKSFRFKERFRVDFIAEAFNLFNHTLVFGTTTNLYNLGKVNAVTLAPCPSTGSCGPALPAFTPRTDFKTPTADQSTLYRERQMQLAIRFQF